MSTRLQNKLNKNTLYTILLVLRYTKPNTIYKMAITYDYRSKKSYQHIFITKGPTTGFQQLFPINSTNSQ
jgi:hypothetical protein